MTEEKTPDRPTGINRPRRRVMPATPVDNILAIDKDILHLAARRTRLLKAAYADPQPPADDEANGERPRPTRRKPVSDSQLSRRTRVEKTLREAWQIEAARISPDQRLARELFTLLQNISIPGHTEAERPKSGGFQLAPSQRPVSVNLPGPASRFEAAVWLALASALGAELRLENVPLGDRAIDALKAFNQAGGKLSWEAEHVLLARSGAALDFSDAVIFVGNEPLALWLIAFLAAPRPGKIKCMGGPDLRSLDITSLRQFAPQLGARLAPVIPGNRGLPARLECSGALPDEIVVPATLPAEALTALLILAATWNTAITINCSTHPEAAACCASAWPILTACGARFNETDGMARYTPGVLKIPVGPRLHMDPLLTASFLALPAFAGGSSRLSGHWDAALPESRAWMELLRDAGLELSRTDTGIAGARSGTDMDKRPPNTLNGAKLPGEALPLLLALAANKAALNGSCLVALPVFSAQEISVAEEFLDRLGCTLEMPEETDAPARVRHARPGDPPPDAGPWAAPSAAWAIGFALGAFVRPGLLLSNPGCLTEIQPAFWPLYNSLPEPRPPAPAPAHAFPEPQAARPARRRIIADRPE